MSADDPQDRLTDVESKLAFQEHAFDALSEVVTDHSGRVDELERRLARLEARLRAGEGGTADGPEPDPLQERPPHY